MPPTQDENPSPATDQTPSAATEAAPTPAPAGAEPSSADTPDPSPSTGADQPASLYDAVRSAIEPRPEDQPSEGGQTDTPPAVEPGSTPDPAGPPPGTPEPPADPEDADEITPADLADIRKPSVRRRMEKLLEQRTSLRREVETIRPDAETWQRTRDFLSENRIAPDDYNTLLGIGALIRRGDYDAALRAINPYVEALQTAAGQRLPPDLQERVDDGRIGEDEARELIRARTAAANAQAEAQLVRQEQDSTRQQQHASAVVSAVTDWERGVQTRDPDYSRKQAAVVRIARALAVERGAPASPDAAVRLAAEAYAEVNRLMGAGRPAPTPTRPSPTSSHTPTQVAPQPKSLREAMHLGLQRAHTAA